MDFCVKCGKKELFQEFLCKRCYAHLHPLRAVKRQKGKSSLSDAKHIGYFEAIIQLRNTEQHVIDFVFHAADEKHVHVSKVKWMKNGVDLFVSDRKFAQHVGKTLQQTFGGMLKTSAAIFTRDRMSGKDVHRVTVLFKQFPYGKGEQFMYKGHVYTVLSVSKEVYVEEIGNKKKRLRFDDLELDRIF